MKRYDHAESGFPVFGHCVGTTVKRHANDSEYIADLGSMNVHVYN